MNLDLPIELTQRYKSIPQRIRVLTETWAQNNLYCPSCTSHNIIRTLNNTELFDFVCPECTAQYQLKATSRNIGRKIVDAAYNVMLQAILADRLPHLLILQYNSLRWKVSDLLLIPSFVLPTSAIEARKPLRSSARRAGWIGCNIILDLVPPEGRIPIIRNGCAIEEDSVRECFKTICSLKYLPVRKRGWTLDVLTVLRSLRNKMFSLSDAYSFEKVLAARHPENQNIRAKIRQQLQIIRDLGYLDFLGQGVYRWRNYVSDQS
jgi:type II restriction enzyme